MDLQQYQRIAEFHNDKDDQVTQVALIVSDLFKYSHEEIDNMEPKKFLRLSKKVTKIFNKLNKKPFFSKYKFITDASKINLGQFIEVQHFIKQGEIKAMHLICASIWKDKRDHKIKAQSLLSVNVRHILIDYTKFLVSFSELIQSYKGLFEVEESEDEEANYEKPHPFIEQYGWIYSAKQVANYEGISLDEAFELPILQAFNDLSYLKSEQSYLKHLNK